MNSLDELRAYLLDSTAHYPAADGIGGHSSAQVDGRRVMALIDAALRERDDAVARAECMQRVAEAAKEETEAEDARNKAITDDDFVTCNAAYKAAYAARRAAVAALRALEAQP